MSVAFRRESDDEHKEPRFEVPVPPGPNIVTGRGYRLLEKRNEELEAQLAEAATEERRAELQRDLRYWRARLATAQIAPVPSGESVAIGTQVTIVQGKRTRLLTIVGHDEADPGSGLLSFAAPLAQALIGAEPGDEVEVGGQPIAIVSVVPASDGA
jgi:transcription elongation GreA/GreB family factor